MRFHELLESLVTEKGYTVECKRTRRVADSVEALADCVELCVPARARCPGPTSPDPGKYKRAIPFVDPVREREMEGENCCCCSVNAGLLALEMERIGNSGGIGNIFTQ